MAVGEPRRVLWIEGTCQSTSAFRSVECGIGLQSWGCRYARVPCAELSTAVLLCLRDVKDLVLQHTDKHRTFTVIMNLRGMAPELAC
jgi:hypothetical protein